MQTPPRPPANPAGPLSPFSERLLAEYETRKAANPRYSLRAFAAFLDTDHAVISQIFKGRRRPPVSRMQTWARKLGMDFEEASAYVTAAHVPDRAIIDRQEQMRHWASESLSIATSPLHFQILQLTHQRGFEPDTRWIAAQTAVTIDEVNLAISRLLRLRLLEMTPKQEWRDLTDPPATTLREFRRQAMQRVRQMMRSPKLPKKERS